LNLSLNKLQLTISAPSFNLFPPEQGTKQLGLLKPCY